MRIPILLVLSVVSASASECLPERLADYEAPGFSCSAPGSSVSFSNFEFSATNTDLNAGEVLVIPLENGFVFTGNFLATTGTMLDAVIGYSVSNKRANTSQAFLSMGGYSTAGGGMVDVAETLCVGASFDSNGACPTQTASLNVFDNGAGDVQQSDSVSLGRAKVVGVVKDIAVDGGTSGVSSVSMLTNTVLFGLEASEPPSWGAVGGLLLAACVAKRRRWLKF